MTLGAFKYTLQHGEIRNNTTGIEVLGSVEHEMVSIRRDFQVVVTRIHSTAHKVVVREDEFMGSLGLFGSSDDAGGGRPKEMVAQ
jgi:hypothetical protein